MIRNLIATIAVLPIAAISISCDRVESAATRSQVTLRLSSGAPTGNFRPFSEALAKGYTRLLPDVRVQTIDTRGSLGNIAALEDGTVDIGLSQAGIAYLAYNGRLRETGNAMRNLRGIAILNSSVVHLLVGPGSSIRTMDELRGHRVGVGPDGSGASVVSEAVLNGYFSPGDVHHVDTLMPQTNTMLLTNTIDAAFAISSVPNDDAKYVTDRGARLLSIRGPAADKLRTTFPFFRSTVIPAGAYAGQGEPVQTLSVDVVLLTRAGLDEVVVRRLTDALFQMLPQLSTELPFLKGMDPERAPATPVPLHAGAALYYRERELKR